MFLETKAHFQLFIKYYIECWNKTGIIFFHYVDLCKSAGIHLVVGIGWGLRI